VACNACGSTQSLPVLRGKTVSRGTAFSWFAVVGVAFAMSIRARQPIKLAITIASSITASGIHFFPTP
jgi:hypothetical protein